MTSIARPSAGYRLVVPVAAVVAAVLVTGVIVFMSDGPADPGGMLVTLAIMLVGGIGFTLIGALILISQPGHRIGWLMVLLGVSLVCGLGVNSIVEAVDPYGFRWAGSELIRAMAETLGALVLLGGVLIVVWFPDGRTASRLGRSAQWIVALVLLIQVAQRVIAAFPEESPWTFVFILAAYVTALVDIVARYRRADGVRRAQIRWVLASGAVSSAVIVVVLVFGDRFWWLYAVWIGSTILPAIAVGIAVTRYHLYEIDRIISRTLTYAGVTVGLFAVFVAANLVAQWALTPFTNGNAIAVAGSTLLAAAAFSPLRTRLQAIVDRRFNRGRYDAERTIDTFAGRLRDELDLTTLSSALQATTRAAVEPASTAVWLRGGTS